MASKKNVLWGAYHNWITRQIDMGKKKKTKSSLFFWLGYENRNYFLSCCALCIWDCCSHVPRKNPSQNRATLVTHRSGLNSNWEPCPFVCLYTRTVSYREFIGKRIPNFANPFFFFSVIFLHDDWTPFHLTHLKCCYLFILIWRIFASGRRSLPTERRGLTWSKANWAILGIYL